MNNIVETAEWINGVRVNAGVWNLRHCEPEDECPPGKAGVLAVQLAETKTAVALRVTPERLREWANFLEDKPMQPKRGSISVT